MNDPLYSIDVIMCMNGGKRTPLPVVAGVLAAVLVRALEEEEEGLAISSRGRVWWGGGLYCATERTGFSFAALSKLASLSIRNLRGERERERGKEREREGKI